MHLTDGMTRGWRDVKQRRLDEGYFAAVNDHLIEPIQLCPRKAQHKDSGKTRVDEVVNLEYLYPRQVREGNKLLSIINLYCVIYITSLQTFKEPLFDPFNSFLEFLD